MLEQLNLEIFRSLQSAIIRSRTLLSVLVVSCVLAIIAYWNGKEDHWTRLRVINEKKFILLGELLEEERDKDQLNSYRLYRAWEAGYLKISDGDSLRMVDWFRALPVNDSPATAQLRDILDPKVDSLFTEHLVKKGRIAPSTARDLNRAMMGSNDIGLDITLAPQKWTIITRAYMENNLLVDLPLIGLAFDLNDLGLMAGLGFSLILLALSFTLMREVSSLQVVHDLILDMKDDGTLSRTVRIRAFQLAAMPNMLTLPPTVVVNRMPGNSIMGMFNSIERRLFSVLSKTIYLIPPLLYWMIMWNDNATARYGDSLSPERMNELAASEIWFMLIIALLSGFSLFASLWLEYRWKDIEQDTV